MKKAFQRTGETSSKPNEGVQKLSTEALKTQISTWMTENLYKAVTDFIELIKMSLKKLQFIKGRL